MNFVRSHLQQTHPKVMTNMLKKVFNWSEVHLSKVTSYKIHTLETAQKQLNSIETLKLEWEEYLND